MNKKVLFKEIMLVITTIIWGLGFIAQSIGGKSLDAFTFNFSRNVVASLFLLIVVLINNLIKKKKNIEQEPLDKKGKINLIFGGFLIGSTLALAMTFQQLGINSEGAGKSGFLTALYIVFVPVLGLLFGRRINRYVLIAILFALTGLYLINVNSGDFTLNIGTIYLLLCALTYSFQIMLIDKYSKTYDSFILSFVQFLFATIVLIPFVFIFGEFNIDLIIEALPSILFLGILSSGVAYTLQVVAQRDVNVTVACIIMSLESVFSLIFGVVFLSESHELIQYFGCLAIFIAVILSQIEPKKEKEKIQ
ncbi:DMT family transporter [bacterium]|nr:DMT family transporter [bacterium]